MVKIKEGMLKVPQEWLDTIFDSFWHDWSLKFLAYCCAKYLFSEVSQGWKKQEMDKKEIDQAATYILQLRNMLPWYSDATVGVELGKLFKRLDGDLLMASHEGYID